METTMMKNRCAKKGSVLVIAMIMAAVASMFILSYFARVGYMKGRADIHEKWVTAKYLAESGSKLATNAVVQSLSYGGTPLPDGIVYVEGNPIEYKVEQIGDASEPQITPEGAQIVYRTFKITATSIFDGVYAQVYRQVETGELPLFQFAIFYENNLEFHPEGTTTVTGRIRGNSDVILGGTDVSSTVTLLPSAGKTISVAATGELSRTRLDGTPTAGTVTIDGKALNYDSSDPNWADQSKADWNGGVATNVKRFNIPQMGNIDPFVKVEDSGGGGNYNLVDGAYVKVPDGTGAYKEGFFHSEAKLVILDNAAYKRDASGNLVDVTLQVFGTAVTESSFYDKNVGKVVTVSELDTSKLKQAGLWPENGLLYIARTDCTADQPNGVRLMKDSNLDDRLTIVCPNPVYISGHYNSSGAKKPAALICDSVNFLSVSFTDSKADRNMDQLTVGGSAKVNLAIIAGTPKTTAGQYSGGAENFGLFQECWGGLGQTNEKGVGNDKVVDPLLEQGANHKMWVTGSLVSLGESKYRSNWNSSNYVAPERMWEYDTDFDDPTKLPPYTPKAVVVNKSVYWIEKEGTVLYSEVLKQISSGNITPSVSSKIPPGQDNNYNKKIP